MDTSCKPEVVQKFLVIDYICAVASFVAACKCSWELGVAGIPLIDWLVAPAAVASLVVASVKVCGGFQLHGVGVFGLLAKVSVGRSRILCCRRFWNRDAVYNNREVLPIEGRRDTKVDEWYATQVTDGNSYVIIHGLWHLFSAYTFWSICTAYALQ